MALTCRHLLLATFSVMLFSIYLFLCLFSASSFFWNILELHWRWIMEKDTDHTLVAYMQLNFLPRIFCYHGATYFLSHFLYCYKIFILMYIGNFFWYTQKCSMLPNCLLIKTWEYCTCLTLLFIHVLSWWFFQVYCSLSQEQWWCSWSNTWWPTGSKHHQGCKDSWCI